MSFKSGDKVIVTGGNYRFGESGIVDSTKRNIIYVKFQTIIESDNGKIPSFYGYDLTKESEFLKGLEKLETRMLFIENNECLPSTISGWFTTVLPWGEVVGSVEQLDSDIEIVERQNFLTKRALSIIYEKSHGLLKYTYRFGFDIDTGKQVAVKFIMEPERITRIADPKQVKQAIELQKSKETPETFQQRALGFVKEKIKKLGHIDHVTDNLTVDSIFYRDGGNLDKIRMIGLVSPHAMKIIMENMRKRLSERPDSKYKFEMEMQKEIRTLKFKTELVKRMTQPDVQKEIETYHVSKDTSEGEKQGKGKFKSTKLFWSIPMFSSFQWAPAARGTLKTYKHGMDDDKLDKLAMKYDGTNRPSRGSMT